MTPIGYLGTQIFDQNFDFVDEVIATETEACLKINESFDPSSLSQIEQMELPQSNTATIKHLELPIWFHDECEVWDAICAHTRINKENYIERLLDCKFSVAMIGFLPGFVYLNGLPPELHVPRKATPSTRTSANSFAIGGKYAGIYSLPSPAGWNVVGKVADNLFDRCLVPPVKAKSGDTVKLKRVNEPEFLELLNASQFAKPKRDSNAGDKLGSLHIEKPGLMTVLQDQGRSGLAFYAIPRGGAMDVTAASLANSILGNETNSAVIECHFIPPTIRFNSEATICLTGANMRWRIDGTKVGRNRTVEVTSGSALTGSAAKDACRAYIAVRGEINTQKTFGSASCYLPGKFGGNDGRPFAAGDRLQWAKPSEPLFPLRIDMKREDFEGVPFELIPGPEFDWLDRQSQDALQTNSFSVSSESDRMGARLIGPSLSTDGKMLSDSVPLLPGMIQLTPAGQCIVVLQDGQTTGGYPRIGFLHSHTVERLNQTPAGISINFGLHAS